MRGHQQFQNPFLENLDAKLNVGFKSMRKTSYSTSSSCLHSREFKSNHVDFYLFTLHVVSGPVKSKKRMQPQDHTWCARSQNRRFSKMHFVLYVYNCPKISKKSYNSIRFVTFLRQPKNMEKNVADLQTNKTSSQWRPAEVTSHFGP